MGPPPPPRGLSLLRLSPLRLSLSHLWPGYVLLSLALTGLSAGFSGGSLLFCPALGLAFALVACCGTPALPLALAGVTAQVLSERTLAPAHPLLGLPWSLLHSLALTAVLAGAALIVRRRWDDQDLPQSLNRFLLSALIMAPLGVTGLYGLPLNWGGRGIPLQEGAGTLLGVASSAVILTAATVVPIRAPLHPIASRLSGRELGRPAVQTVLLTIVPVLILLTRDLTPLGLLLMGISLLPVLAISWRPGTVRSPILLGLAFLALSSLTLYLGAEAWLFEVEATFLIGSLSLLYVGTNLITRLESELHRQEASGRWQALVDAAPMSVVRISPTGVWHTEPGTVVPDPQIVHGAQRVPELAAAVQAGRRACVSWSLRSTAAPLRHFVTQLTPMAGGQALAVTTETTQIHTAQAELAWERTHDRESGLANRTLFLSTTLSRDPEAPGSIAVLDVGDVCARAELLGIGQGEVFGQLRESIASALRMVAPGEEPELLARVGEDQIAILLPVSPGNAVVRLRRVVHHVTGTVRSGPSALSIHPCGGVAGLGPGTHPAQALLGALNAAATARQTGRGDVVIFDPFALLTAAQRAQLSAGIAASIESGELQVVFQPDVDLSTGRVTGLEALVRWHPAAGAGAPTEEFVKLAEDSGAVLGIDRWVMDRSLAQVAQWQRLPGLASLELGINVSARSLTSDLPLRLAEACQRHGVPLHTVRLEVTETALADDGSAGKILRAIRKLGARVAMDDFGTGYASLSRLSHLPIDVLKLDRSFLSSMVEDPASAAVVSLALGLAEPLNLDVIVEGVETEAQRSLLLDLGCQRAQGFLFSRPRSAERIEKVLLEESARRGARAASQASGGLRYDSEPARTDMATLLPSATPSVTTSAQ